MSRNTSVENLRKLAAIKVGDWKIDIANFVYNPSHSYEYPSLVKALREDEDRKYFVRISYFKHYDGSGEYSVETYSRRKEGGADPQGWQIVTDSKDKVLEAADRFSMSRLKALAIEYDKASEAV